MTNERNNEELRKLFAIPKTYLIPQVKIEGEEQASIEFMPLSLDNVEVLEVKEGATTSEIALAAKTMFALSMDIPEDIAGKLLFKYLKDLLNAFMDVNGLSEEDSKNSSVLDFLHKKRDQVAKEKENEGTDSA